LLEESTDPTPGGLRIDGMVRISGYLVLIIGAVAT
jgi:hypothetical protein